MLRLIEAIRRLIRAGLALLVVTGLAVCGWTFLWPIRDAHDIPKSDTIICLGAGMDADGTLHASSIGRVARCVELYEAGVAPLVIFTGGPAVPGGPTAGARMALTAETMGLPRDAALIEGAAQSTLQNALFSLPMVPGADRLTLVSEAFHLPRAWVSFRWAGATRTDLVASEPLRRTPSGAPEWPMLAREVAALWFNAVRAVAFSAGGWAGIPEDARIAWLR